MRSLRYDTSTLAALAMLGVGAVARAATPVSLRQIYDPNASAPLHEAPASAVRTQRPSELESAPRDRAVYFGVDHYGLDLDVDPTAGTIRGSVEVDFTALISGLDAITLDADDMQIASVTTLDGRTAAFTYDGTLLTVKLPSPLGRGQHAAVVVRYATDQSQSLYVTGADVTSPERAAAAYTYSEPEGASVWWPCLDRPVAKAPVDLVVRVPAGFNALSNGDLVAREPVGAQTQFRYNMAAPIATYLVSLNIGRYDVVHFGDFRGKPLTVWTPAALRAAATRETSRTAVMMDAIASFAGTDYPWHGYAQSVAQAYRTSMEHQSATTMGGWRITGDGSGEAVVAHELGHQWFGDFVTCRNWGELWLNEGFASYAPYVFFDRTGEEARRLGQVDAWRAAYFEEARSHAHPLSQPAPDDLESIFDNHAYDKGALVIHLMRHVADRLGGGPVEPFTLALREYLAHQGFQSATSQDLQAALETVTGTSWQQFFDQWVRSAGHPVLTVRPSWANGTLSLDVEQTQATRTTATWRAFTFPLDVEIVAQDGRLVRQTLEVYADRQTFTMPLPAAPKGVAIDPSWFVPAEITVDQNADAWQAVLAAAPEPQARVDAVRGLAAISNGALPAAALDLVAKDASVYVSEAALEQLTAASANQPSVTTVANALRARASLPVTTRATLASADRWLVASLGTVPSRDQERAWQERFLATDLVAERHELLSDLVDASRENAQTFALARLAESRWVMQDRTALVDVLTVKPTATSQAFIESVLAKGTRTYLRQTLANLTAAGFDSPAVVSSLIAGAQSYRDYYVRSEFMRLLAKQKSSKDVACPAAKALVAAGVGTLRADYLSDLRSAATAAVTALGCTP